MNTITFYRILLVVVMSLLLPQFSFCQGLSTRNLTRGADTGEIYLSCQWYSDCHNTINGIFRSIDNGESLSVQRKTIWAIGAGPIFGDSVSGALFLIPYNSIDTFGISFDYGKTFEKKYYHNIYEGASGCMAGELYMQGFGLYHGTGYGQYFTLQITNDSLRLQDVGANPGEVYCITNNGINPIKLAYSNDYAHTFSINDVNLPGMRALFDECDIHRGTQPGELYFVVWKSFDTVALYHTFDYAQTLTFQSYMLQTSDELLYTAGRTPGTFYYVRREICGTPPCFHSCLWIYFSRDYGVTFTTYFHSIDSVYTGVPLKKTDIELKIFPNPANDRITFRFWGNPTDSEYQATLYDLVGKPVLEGIIPKGQLAVTLDTKSLAPGLYCYKITNNGKSVIANANMRVSQQSMMGKVLIIR